MVVMVESITNTGYFDAHRMRIDEVLVLTRWRVEET